MAACRHRQPAACMRLIRVLSKPWHTSRERRPFSRARSAISLSTIARVRLRFYVFAPLGAVHRRSAGPDTRSAVKFVFRDRA